MPLRSTERGGPPQNLIVRGAHKPTWSDYHVILVKRLMMSGIRDIASTLSSVCSHGVP